MHTLHSQASAVAQCHPPHFKLYLLVFSISCFYRNASIKNKISTIKFCSTDSSEHKSGGGQDCILNLQSSCWAEEYKLLTQLTLLLQQFPLPYIRSSAVSMAKFSRKMKLSVMPIFQMQSCCFLSTGKAVEQQIDNGVIWGKFHLSLSSNTNARS